MYVCITYVTTVYHITDSNNIAVMHQPNNHQVKVHKMKKFSPVAIVQSSIPVQSSEWRHPFDLQGYYMAT